MLAHAVVGAAAMCCPGVQAGTAAACAAAKAWAAVLPHSQDIKQVNWLEKQLAGRQQACLATRPCCRKLFRRQVAVPPRQQENVGVVTSAVACRHQVRMKRACL